MEEQMIEDKQRIKELIRLNYLLKRLYETKKISDGIKQKVIEITIQRTEQRKAELEAESIIK